MCCCYYCYYCCYYYYYYYLPAAWSILECLARQTNHVSSHLIGKILSVISQSVNQLIL